MNNDKILPIIFTDLDGSLLDHFTYSFEPAVARLKQLKEKNIPVVPNTSKTRAELTVLRQALAGCDPFIVENGAAVFLPREKPFAKLNDLPVAGDFFYKNFSKPRSHWLQVINSLTPELQSKFNGFNAMTAQELVSATGLSVEDAELAKLREFNEPGSWNGTEEEKKSFIQHLEELGAVVLQGGRFMHVGGLTDKGSAMIWLSDLYQQLNPSRQVISLAFGDSDNDKDMLEQADLSVVIKSPVHPYPTLHKQQHAYYTVNEGPTGWVEGLDHHLHQLKIF